MIWYGVAQHGMVLNNPQDIPWQLLFSCLSCKLIGRRGKRWLGMGWFSIILGTSLATFVFMTMLNATHLLVEMIVRYGLAQYDIILDNPWDMPSKVCFHFQDESSLVIGINDGFVWHGMMWFLIILGACLATFVFMSRMKTQCLMMKMPMVFS